MHLGAAQNCGWECFLIQFYHVIKGCNHSKYIARFDIKIIENKKFEAFFFIFSNLLGISVAIGDIIYIYIYIYIYIDIWQLKNPKKI
jgi:hypothetical protein